MVNETEVVNRLKSQHREMRNDLSTAMAGLENSSRVDVVVEALGRFKLHLLEHFKLEDEVFYPDYLRKKAMRGENTSRTKEFVDEMVEIGKSVKSFLGKYETAVQVESSRESLRKELSEIIRTLNLRIETEEESVYDVYLAMKGK